MPGAAFNPGDVSRAMERQQSPAWTSVWVGSVRMAWPRLQLLVGLGLVASKKYKYPGDDKGLECLSFRSEHREQLTLAEINHQFADDGELALWRTGQQFFARPKRNAKLVAGKYLDVGCGTGASS